MLLKNASKIGLLGQNDKTSAATARARTHGAKTAWLTPRPNPSLSLRLAACPLDCFKLCLGFWSVQSLAGKWAAANVDHSSERDFKGYTLAQVAQYKLNVDMRWPLLRDSHVCNYTASLRVPRPNQPKSWPMSMSTSSQVRARHLPVSIIQLNPTTPTTMLIAANREPCPAVLYCFHFLRAGCLSPFDGSQLFLGFYCRLLSWAVGDLHSNAAAGPSSS